MKKYNLIFSMLSVFLISLGTLKAQVTYDVLYHANAGNPGGVNTNNDTYVTNATQLSAGGESSNFWSSTYALPFAFDFYGNAVTHFKVSGNGVLTFDTTATAIPVDGNTNLPAAVNTNIPNLSILSFWDAFSGSAPVGSTDRIYANVFGSSPNRQVWVDYYSYEYGSTGTGQIASYAYWSFVIEEGTNKVYAIDKSYSSGGGGLTATIGVQESVSSAVQYGSNNIGMGSGSFQNSDNDYYEFTPRVLVQNDAQVVSIDSPTNPISLGSQMVTATISNQGTSVLTSAIVNWSVNGALQTPLNYTGSLATNATVSLNLGAFNFTGVSTIAVWTTMPNNMVDGNTSNDTIQVNVYPGLSGIVTVDSSMITGGTNYNNFNDLQSALNQAGVVGPLVVNVAPNTYNEQFSLGKIDGSSATNTIVIDGGSASTTAISHDRSIRNSTITIEGTSYLTIKNMTVIATSSTNDTWGINIIDSSRHIHIDSNIVTMQTGSLSDVAGINMCNETSDNSSAGFYGDDITISNNLVTGGERGITLYGSSSSSSSPRNTNIMVSNNTTQNTDDHGIYLYGFENLSLLNNHCVNATNNTSNDGIYIADVENFVISGNYAKGSDYGLYAADLNYDNPVTTRSIIVNNMIIGGDDALYLDDVEEIDIFHNSTYAEDFGIYINDDFNLDIRNNIFASNSDYAFNCNDLSTTMTLNSNLYYTGGSDLAKYSSVYTDLAAFIIGQPTLNDKSIEGYPSFVSPTTDLHISGPFANDKGDATVGILVDYDGDARPMTPSVDVDMGADEYTPVVCVVPSNLTSLNITDSSAIVSWVEAGAATQWAVEYGPSGFTIGTGTVVFVTDTFADLRGLLFETDYEWHVRAVCGRADTSLGSTSTFYTGYCNPAPLSVQGTGIVGVAYDTVNNITGVEPSNYGNYSAQIGDIQNNLLSNIDITLSTGYTYDVKIWIDFNKDLDFNDAGEMVYSGTSPSTNPTTLTAPIFIPSSNPLGQYRMRIGAIDDGNLTPCYTGIWGAFEDYTINVIQGPSCPAPNLLELISVGSDSAVVSWNELGSSVQWEVEYDTASFSIGSGSSMIVNLDTFATINGLDAQRTYYWYVRSICGSGDTSAWVGPMNFTTQQVPLVYYPIGIINTEDAIGVSDSLGVNCAISGTVVGVDKRGGGYEFTMIDMSTGSQEGITVYKSSDLPNYTSPLEGDSLYIEGVVSQYNGLIQFEPDSINIISVGNAIPSPIIVTNLDESTESKWLSIPTNFVSLSSSSSGSFNIDITNGVDTFILRVDSDTDIDDSLITTMTQINPGDTICGLLGVGGQFDYSSPYTSEYQIFPMKWSDITICKLLVGIETKESEKIEYSLVPNPTNNRFEIRSTKFNSSSVNITIRNINGAIIYNEKVSNATKGINKSFDLSGNAKGIYFITIQDGDNLINEKLILQ